MKTRIRSIAPVLLLLSLLVSITASARQVRVNVLQKETIAAAIIRCDRGDTLIIPSGFYQEPTIVIDRPLVVMGENFPAIDGQKKNEIIQIKSDSVTVCGLKLQNPGRSDMTDMAALKVFNGRHVTVRSNIIEQAYFAIYMQGAKQCMVYNNFIHGVEASEMMSGNGIHCWSCDSMRIFQNNISSHRDGIYFEFVTNSMILGNYSHNNVRYGLHFMFSHNDVYTSNIFEANGAGVAVMYTKGVSMLHNVFRYNWGAASYGLLLKDISDSHISGNVFEENTVAIHMEGSSRMIITNNNFLSNGWAAQVQASCMDNTMTRNNFSGNSFDIATNGDMVLSSFDGNYWDKYEGYDIARDGTGDVPYRPVGLYAVIVEKLPTALMLYRSPITALMDKAEKVIPGMTPVDLIDNQPRMNSITTRYD
jgi:nitrous oxidase accessory protein